MIRLASISDLDNIMDIIYDIQEDMKIEENPQWSQDYPNKQRFIQDIEEQSLYVLEEEQILKGFICIQKDDNSYNELLENTNQPSFILHRLAVNKNCRHQNIASKLMAFSEELAKEHQIKLLKADTEKHNFAMNSLFQKMGFRKMGEFIYSDYPGEYIYYEKNLD